MLELISTGLGYFFPPLPLYFFFGLTFVFFQCVQAENPFERKDRFSYFESTILRVGDRSEVSIGVTKAGYDLDSLPGWHFEYLLNKRLDSC